MHLFFFVSVLIWCGEICMTQCSSWGASGFSASISKSKHVVRGGIIRFDKVWSNIGNNFDQYSSVYTAPRNGAYHFSCTVMSHRNRVIRVNLWKNHSKTVAVYSQSHYGGTLNMVLDLKRGDRVYIKQSANGNFIYAEPDYHFSMFSGFLIQAHE